MRTFLAHSLKFSVKILELFNTIAILKMMTKKYFSYFSSNLIVEWKNFYPFWSLTFHKWWLDEKMSAVDAATTSLNQLMQSRRESSSKQALVERWFLQQKMLGI